MSNADLGQYLNAFLHNDQLKLVVFLIFADIVLGVIAAFLNHQFVLKHLSAFLRDDVLEKVVPWFALFCLGKANSGFDIVGGLDFGTLADAAFVGVSAALLGSLLKSLSDMHIAGDLPEALAGSYGSTRTPPS
jgi:hypothetical protein